MERTIDEIVRGANPDLERNNRVFDQQHKSWVEVARGMVDKAALWRLANAAVPGEEDNNDSALTVAEKMINP
uniref:Uncharacterized protein n=1 Tax=Oryza barthii TaxID=65489 RepID=A0A0D3HFS3_9ORYZ